MKKLLTSVLVIIVSNCGFSQAENSKKNEIRLNLLYLTAGYPELSYERTLLRKSAIGASIGGFIGSPVANYAADMIAFDYAFLPYYRYYFGKRISSGFFLENNLNFFYREYHYEKKTGLGDGLALGV